VTILIGGEMLITVITIIQAILGMACCAIVNYALAHASAYQGGGGE
jgi:hypothetical protein